MNLTVRVLKTWVFHERNLNTRSLATDFFVFLSRHKQKVIDFIIFKVKKKIKCLFQFSFETMVK